MSGAAALLELNDPFRGRLVVGSGETVVLLGPSGGGKTRLIRALLGLEASGPPRPEPVQPEPVMWVRGRRAPPRELAALVGWVPEGDGVFLSDTVWDNVAHPPGVESALLATATAGERAWGADTVALVSGQRLVTQAPLAELVDSTDPEIRSVLSWVSP